MRRLLLVLLLAAVVLPELARAQRRGPYGRHRHHDRYGDVRSNARGLMLESSLGASGLTVEEDDAGQGGAVAFRIGYGFTDHVAAFVGLHGATLVADRSPFTVVDGEGEYGFGSADVGVEVTFGSARHVLRPYLNAGLSGVAAAFDVPGDDVSVLGGGLTLGAGLKVYVVPTLALNAGLQVIGGRFTDVQVDDRTEDLPFEPDFGAARAQVGLTWNPFR